MSRILEVEQVSKRYRNGRGVQEICFSLDEGDIFGLIGLNGAGKSTLLKIITGLIRPHRGIVRIAGHRVDEQTEQAMRQVGCLIETADAYANLSGYENLELAARFYPDLPKSRIDEVLELVQLTSYGKERVAVYSLGMRQRLALASALLARPRLVILDEPMNGLDVEGMAAMRNAIRTLACEQGMTFLISSHLIHDLGLIANRIGIMREGRFICLGKVDQLLDDPMNLESFVLAQLHSAKDANAHA